MTEGTAAPPRDRPAPPPTARDVTAPAGTKVAKVYAESLRGEAHLERLIDEAQALVEAVTAQAVTTEAAG